MTAAESFGVRFAPYSQKLHRRTHTYVTGYLFSCLFACSYNGFKVVSASVLSRMSASNAAEAAGGYSTHPLHASKWWECLQNKEEEKDRVRFKCSLNLIVCICSCILIAEFLHGARSNTLYAQLHAGQKVPEVGILMTGSDVCSYSVGRIISHALQFAMKLLP